MSDLMMMLLTPLSKNIAPSSKQAAKNYVTSAHATFFEAQLFTFFFEF
jgi:hypothetical protein